MRLGLPILWMLSLLACSRDSKKDNAIFERGCAGCHDGLVKGAPSRSALRKMTPEAVVAALESGTMKAAGAMLSSAERRDVAEYLSHRRFSSAPPPAVTPGVGFCDSSVSPRRDLLRGPRWNGWGVDLSNSRYQPAAMTGLRSEDLGRLRLRWAFGSPSATFARAQPTVAGGRVYFGNADGVVYSVESRSGCILWAFQATSEVRTAISIGRVAGEGPARHLAYFGDLKGIVYAVDALSGAVVWRTQVDDHPYARITGAPILHDGRLYVPMSSSEEVAAMNPAYPCCSFRGSVTALDATDGRIVWKTFTSPDSARLTKRGKKGAESWGPSGAAVWSAPTLDTLRKAIYVTTGDSYSDPVQPLSDAIVALDMATGKIRWWRQMTIGDTFNYSCIGPKKVTCPEVAGPDFDFGASAILRRWSNGRGLLIAGQKSGVVHAVDPDREGAIVWQTQLGKGGKASITWGLAADTSVVYVAVTTYDRGAPDDGGAVSAIRLRDGTQQWYTPSPSAGCAGEAGCSGAQSAAVTLIPGALFSGSRDGHLRAYSTIDGAIIWDYDTRREFDTANRVKARGGSLNAAGAVIVDGMLFVRSGHSFGGMPGNVLLAFALEHP